ncbi:MAG: quinol monooxygenase YgiN [Flavobacterium sp.]|jgi:quinol monooxygenase YgiN
MIIVWGRMTANDGDIDNLIKVSLEHVHRSREEPGCLHHSVQVDVENAQQLVFYEEWEDMAALQTHFKVPGSNQFVTEAKKMCSSKNFDMKMYEASLF